MYLWSILLPSFSTRSYLAQVRHRTDIYKEVTLIHSSCDPISLHMRIKITLLSCAVDHEVLVNLDPNHPTYWQHSWSPHYYSLDHFSCLLIWTDFPNNLCTYLPWICGILLVQDHEFHHLSLNRHHFQIHSWNLFTFSPSIISSSPYFDHNFLYQDFYPNAWLYHLFCLLIDYQSFGDFSRSLAANLRY